MLEQCIGLSLFRSTRNITFELVERFKDKWLYDRYFDEKTVFGSTVPPPGEDGIGDGAPPQSTNGNVPEWPDDLAAVINEDEVLAKLRSVVQREGDLAFGFYALMPVKGEARYGDFVKSDVYRRLSYLDRAKYDVSASLFLFLIDLKRPYHKEGKHL
jgi:hypothetical protein